MDLTIVDYGQFV